MTPHLLPVFGFFDYRAYLRGIIELNPEWRAFKTRLAESAGCTSSFLTQVLNETASFSFDHLHGICKFLGLSTDEWGYLRELLVAEKCSTSETRADAMRCAGVIRERYGGGLFHGTPPRPVDANSLSAIRLSLLHWDVFHILGAPDVSTPAKLAAKFKVPQERIMSILHDWQRCGLVEPLEGDEWRCCGTRFQGSAVMKQEVNMMYKIRAMARAFDGEAPRVAAARMLKKYVPELEKKAAELYAEAWRLALASEGRGDTTVFLAVDLGEI